MWSLKYKKRESRIPLLLRHAGDPSGLISRRGDTPQRGFGQDRGADGGYRIFVGEQYAKAGYRGYYDVDFVAGRGGELFVTESNVRRTGGTHVYAVANRIFGKEFMYETYTLSCNTYPLPEGKSLLLRRSWKYSSRFCLIKKTREGVILVSENMLERGQMQYIIFGQNKKRALELEAEMERLLLV